MLEELIRYWMKYSETVGLQHPQTNGPETTRKHGVGSSIKSSMWSPSWGFWRSSSCICSNRIILLPLSICKLNTQLMQRTMLCLVTQLCLTLCDPMDSSLPGSAVHGDFPGVGCHALLQGIFPTGLPHCRWILYHLSHQRSPMQTEYWFILFSLYHTWRSPAHSPQISAWECFK